LALGPKFLELGLRAKDRDINRRVKLLRDYAAASPASTAFRWPSAAIRSTRIRCEAERERKYARQVGLKRGGTGILGRGKLIRTLGQPTIFTQMLGTPKN
jgi:hypothetical protein